MRDKVRLTQSEEGLSIAYDPDQSNNPRLSLLHRLQAATTVLSRMNVKRTGSSTSQ